MATSGLINIGGGSSTPMIGATTLLDGESGAVPQPLAGEEAYLLSGAGTWVEAPTTQDLTWGMNYWAATGSMTNAVVSFPFVATATRQTLAPTAQRISLGVGTFTGAGITRDTTNNRLVIETPGRYSISADMITTPASATESGVQLIKNGTTILTMNTRLNSANAAYLGSNLAWEGDLVATDYLELRGWVQIGTGTFFVDGGTFIVSQQPTAVAPVVNTIAEYGEIAITDSVTRLGTAFGDLSVNQTFTVPSAGTWRIGYQVSSTNGSSAAATTAFQLVNVTAGNIVVPNSSRFAIRAANGSNSQVSLSTIVTVSVPTTYKLQAATSNGTMAIDNTNNVVDGSGNSHFSYEKIAGQLPSTGQSVDYVQAGFTNSPTLSSGTDIIVNQVHSGNIPLNTSTGVFTLTADKTYSFEAYLSIVGFSASTTGNIQFNWVDATTNNVLVANKTSISSPSTYTVALDFNPNIGITYTPVTNQTVKLRVTAAGGTATLDNTSSSVKITQIGSSSYTTLNTFTGATSGVAGAVGGVPQPIAGEQDKFLRGDGTWSKPVFSGARRFASAATSIPNTDVDTLVTTGTVEYTAGSDVTTAVANQIAIVTTGYYRLTAVVRIATGASTTHYYASVRVNGTTVAQAGGIGSVSDTTGSVVTATKLLTAGDIVSLGARQASGGAQSTSTGSASTYIEVEFLGV